MKQFISSHVERLRFFLPAVILGASLGIFIHDCWLINIFSIESNWLLPLTVGVSLLGTAGYFLLFRWMRNGFSGWSGLQQATFAGLSLLVSVFLFFAVLNCRTQPSRYIDYFLPTHSLQAFVFPTQDSATVAILQFDTLLGHVPYEAIEYKGWKRENKRLVLTDFSNNEIRWTGKTGEEVQITFESSSPNGEMVVSWDGEKTVFPHLSKRYTYTRPFSIPFFASQTLLLGLLNVIALSTPFFVLVRKKRTELAQYLTPMMRGMEGQIRGREWGLVLCVMIFALLLRIPNLNMWFLIGVDEYSHLNAAKWIIENASLNVEYERSLWLVTLPVSLAFRILGYKIWVARLVGVLFNMAAIIPLYLITRKINRNIAMLSVLLYATSPWVITFSRIVREYAYYPFYYCWIIYLMILFLEKFPDRFRISENWKVLFSPSLVLLEASLVLPPVYALYIDSQSTFKLILLAYVVLALFVLGKMDFGDKKNTFVLLCAGIAIIAVGYMARRIIFSHIAPGFNTIPIDYFLPNPQQQWFFNKMAIVPAVGLLLAILLGFFMWSVNSIPLFIFGLYVGFLGFFVTLSEKPFFAPRHLSSANLWFIVLIAVGLYLVWIFLQSFPFLRSMSAKIATIITLGLVVINPSQILLPVTSQDALGFIAQDYFSDPRSVQNYLVANAENGDALISATPYLRQNIWAGTPEFSATHFLSIYATEDDTIALTHQYKSGWIIIDLTRVESLPYSPFDAFLKDGRIVYIGLFGDEHVWHWKN